MEPDSGWRLTKALARMQIAEAEVARLREQQTLGNRVRADLVAECDRLRANLDEARTIHRLHCGFECCSYLEKLEAKP